MKNAAVTLQIPSVLRATIGGARDLALSATTVRGALEEIERRHPALYHSICDETGKVRRHVNLFVNSAHVRDRDGLDTPLRPGDDLIVLPAVSGG